MSVYTTLGTIQLKEDEMNKETVLQSLNNCLKITKEDDLYSFKGNFEQGLLKQLNSMSFNDIDVLFDYYEVSITNNYYMHEQVIYDTSKHVFKEIKKEPFICDSTMLERFGYKGCMALSEAHYVDIPYPEYYEVADHFMKVTGSGWCKFDRTIDELIKVNKDQQVIFTSPEEFLEALANLCE